MDLSRKLTLEKTPGIRQAATIEIHPVQTQIGYLFDIGYFLQLENKVLGGYVPRRAGKDPGKLGAHMKFEWKSHTMASPNQFGFLYLCSICSIPMPVPGRALHNKKLYLDP